MNNAIDVAEYILYYCESKLEKPITNLKLQKFLYYTQGITLAIKNEPLFVNDIEAWRYGPVVPDVYYYFCNNISNPICGIKPKNNDLDSLAINIIESFCSQYINMKAWELVEKTHKEKPWEDNYIPGLNQLININDIANWFKKNLKVTTKEK